MNKQAAYDLLIGDETGILEWNRRRITYPSLDLSHLDFGCADLRNADLRGCNLDFSDLGHACGLKAHQIEACSLEGAILPAHLATTFDLDGLRSAYSESRNIFISLVAVSVYFLFTVLGTTDVQLFRPDEIFNLPIINMPITTRTMFVIGPFFLLVLYLHFLVHFVKGQWRLKSMPLTLPSGIQLDQIANVWLLTAGNTRKEKSKNVAVLLFQKLQKLMSILGIWCMVPITMGTFWMRFMPMHKPIISGAHALGVVIALTAMYTASRAVQASPASHDPTKSDVRSILSVTAVLLISFLSITALLIQGESSHSYHKPNGEPVKYFSEYCEPALSKTLMVLPDLMRIVGYNNFWYLEGASLSQKNLDQVNQQVKRNEVIAPAQLKSTNLDYSYMRKTFLDNADAVGVSAYGADLYRASANGADFFYSDMRCVNARRLKGEGIKFNHSDLRHANFSKAKLKNARLNCSDLRNTNFQLADLKGAELFAADARGANFKSADFEGAKMDYTNLSGTDLSKARHLTPDQLNRACVDETTILPSSLDISDVIFKNTCQNTSKTKNRNSDSPHRRCRFTLGPSL